MKRKRNIYDADDAAKSKRLHFSPEERAAHAERKAEILGEKLEKAKADLPKKRRARINRQPEKPGGAGWPESWPDGGFGGSQ